MSQNVANVRQRRVARTLRDWRRSKGATQEEVAKPLNWSVPKLSRFERADTIAGPAEIIAIGTVLGIEDAERDRLVRLATASIEPGWWNTYTPDAVRLGFEDYLEAEEIARRLQSFEIHLVPGLLQTAGYYEAILREAVKGSHEELLNERRQLRQERQARLNASDNPLTYHAIVHESALRLPIGGPEVMRNQLRHLLSRNELPNVTIQILPIDAGAYPGLGCAYHLITSGPDDVQGVYLENLHDGLYLEDDAEIQVYTLAFERLEGRALSPAASVRRITELHEHWK
ncbi:helix-turn-helix domain-containing protein [Saccharopolyspora phatthalungensis]|uniref:Transcriptional regulator with XRE-family HTH domain n=1 Tax=Saccharopolyspora phatthalungensis TaxID=664693 RepID=A0A840Q5P0_9PSEU|nr:helix-turn-helix transcriptional regulator [Saccharopolyspora phatthalungensis]MBB5157822.1 transcriptional regulator with XRE-family HTH domain [Saccharopolyspora phatthalungensis]